MSEDWTRRLQAAPIDLEDGRQLVTLDDARAYLTAQRLPKSEEHRQLLAQAIKSVMGAANGTDFLMHARKAVSLYVHRNEKPEEPAPRRKAVKSYRILK